MSRAEPSLAEHSLFPPLHSRGEPSRASCAVRCSLGRSTSHGAAPAVLSPARGRLMSVGRGVCLDGAGGGGNGVLGSEDW